MRKLLMIIFSIFISFSIFTNSQEVLEFSMKKMESSESNKLNLYKSFNIIQTEENSYKLEGTTLLELTKMKDGLYTIILTLGNPKQEFEVIVDTGSFLLWVPSSKCDTCYLNKNKLNDLSTSLVKNKQKLELRYISGKISGEVCLEELKISKSLSIPKFKFLLSDKVDAPVKVDGIIGLSRMYNKNYDNSFSLIDALYKEGKIEKKIFSQKIEEDESESIGKFTIGKLPKEIENDIQNLTKCKTISDDNSVSSYWTCNLTQVLFLKNENDKNILNIFSSTNTKKAITVSTIPKPAIFDTGSNVVIAPEEYVDILKNIFFKELIENKSCYLLNDYDASSGFKCKSDTDFTILPKIKFVFDNDLTYELNTIDLFIKSYNGYLFRIVFGRVPGNGWLLGQPFLKQYHVVFDQEDMTVGMYPLIKNNLVAYKIESLSEFELESFGNYKSLDKSFWFYFGLFYICGLIISLFSVLLWKIFNAYIIDKKYFNKVKSLKSGLLNSTNTFKNEF